MSAPTSNPTLESESRWFYKEAVDSIFTSRDKCPLRNMLKEVHSEDFRLFLKLSKIECRSVETNPHLFKSEMYQKFVAEGFRCSAEAEGDCAERSDSHSTEGGSQGCVKGECEGSTAEEGKDSTEGEGEQSTKGESNDSTKGHKYDLRVVFHGTPAVNVEGILSKGLNPALRKGQAHGQGEYFASNPAMSLSYCRGGKKLLIFAVIAVTSEVRAKDVVVVKDGKRQLPIATLTFGSCGSSALSLAGAFEASVTKLWEEAKEKEKLAREAQSKERIIRLILEGEYLSASDRYKMACTSNGGAPPKSWAEDVAAYVRDHIRDDELVDICFPRLPPRPLKSEDMPVLSSEMCEAAAREAKRKCESFSTQH